MPVFTTKVQYWVYVDVAGGDLELFNYLSLLWVIQTKIDPYMLNTSS